MIGMHHIDERNTAVPDWFVGYYDSGYFWVGVAVLSLLTVVLIVLADRSAPTYLYDGALAMENLMLAAHASGLGSCWIHRAKEAFERPEGKQILKELGIEGDYEGIGHCVLGYPQQEGPSKTPPRKAERVYHID